MTLQQAWQQAVALGLARLDAQLLLLHVLGRPGSDRGWLVAHDQEPLEPPGQQAFAALARRRAAGEPLAYLVG
jgi:release factor glutamine methyltransferase